MSKGGVVIGDISNYGSVAIEGSTNTFIDGAGIVRSGDSFGICGRGVSNPTNYQDLLDDGSKTKTEDGLPDEWSNIRFEGCMYSIEDWEETRVLLPIEVEGKNLLFANNINQTWDSPDGNVNANIHIIMYYNNEWVSTPFEYLGITQIAKDHDSIGDIPSGNFGWKPVLGATYYFFLTSICRDITGGVTLERTNVVEFEWPFEATIPNDRLPCDWDSIRFEGCQYHINKDCEKTKAISEMYVESETLHFPNDIGGDWFSPDENVNANIHIIMYDARPGKEEWVSSPWDYVGINQTSKAVDAIGDIPSGNDGWLPELGETYYFYLTGVCRDSTGDPDQIYRTNIVEFIWPCVGLPDDQLPVPVEEIAFSGCLEPFDIEWPVTKKLGEVYADSNLVYFPNNIEEDWGSPDGIVRANIHIIRQLEDDSWMSTSFEYLGLTQTSKLVEAIANIPEGSDWEPLEDEDLYFFLTVICRSAWPPDPDIEPPEEYERTNIVHYKWLSPPCTPIVIEYSETVFVNNKGVARIDDQLSCDETIETGSSKVFFG